MVSRLGTIGLLSTHAAKKIILRNSASQLDKSAPSSESLQTGGTMSLCTFRRARQPEQKEQRRAAILDAAVAMLDEQGFDGVSLNAIARRVGLAKSNVYRYFGSREEIFVELLIEDATAWTKEVERELAPWAGSDDVVSVAGVLASTCASRERMCQLISVAAPTLEQNVSEQAIVRFKTEMLGLLLRGTNALHAAVPGLPVASCGRFFRLAFALIAGLWPSAQPAPVVVRALARPELAVFRVDFEADLRRGFAALLHGLRSPERPQGS